MTKPSAPDIIAILPKSRYSFLLDSNQGGNFTKILFFETDFIFSTNLDNSEGL